LNTRKYSNKHEKQTALKMDCKIQPNSGATPWKKGDLISDAFLMDCKTSITDKKQFTVKKKELEKLTNERKSMGKVYEALVFNFGPDQENYYVIPERLFKKLKNNK